MANSSNRSTSKDSASIMAYSLGSVIMAQAGIDNRERGLSRPSFSLLGGLPALSQKAFDESGIHFSGAEIGIGQDSSVQRNRCVNSFHNEHLQRPGHS